MFTARKVFIVTAYFNFLYSSVLHFWPLAISSVAEGFVSIQRVQDFLLLPENKDAILLNRNKAHALVVNDELEKLLSNGKEKLADRQVTEKLPAAVGGGDGSDIKVIVNDANGLDKTATIYKNNKNLLNGHDGLVAVDGDRRRIVNENTNKKSILFKDATAGWLGENSALNTGKNQICWYIHKNKNKTNMNFMNSISQGLIILIWKLKLDNFVQLLESLGPENLLCFKLFWVNLSWTLAL